MTRPLERFVLCLAALALGCQSEETVADPDSAPGSLVPGQCDPRGVEPPRYRYEDIPLELELFPDELAARGRCSSWSQPEESDWRSPDAQALLSAARDRSAQLACDGVCEPMRKQLPAFDEKHDLEDATVQAECRNAASRLQTGAEEVCSRVCVAERRQLAARIVYARTLRALEQTLPTTGGHAGDEAALRSRLAQLQMAPPPSSIHLSFEDMPGGPIVRAEGWLYPGGPRMRLTTGLLDVGCGRKGWGVMSW